MIGTGLSTAAVTWSLIGAALLIVVNGLFVAYEFAIIAARRSAFEQEAEEGKTLARAALASISDLSVHLAGSQLGITMASLGLGFVAEPAVESIMENVLGMTFSETVTRSISFFTALAITTFLHLVIGEMIPKNIAIARPEATLRWLVLPYRGYLTVFRPFVRFLNSLANVAVRLVGVEPRDEITVSHSTTELAAIVTLSSQGGGIESDSAELLHGALGFAERPVGEIARPLDEIATIRFGATAAQAEHVVNASGQARIPIVAPSLGEKRFVGYLHAKELLGIDPDQRTAPLPPALTRQMAVVRSERPLIEVLRILRRLGRQLAVVTGDEGPVGIVSVEEVVGAFVVDPVSGQAITKSGTKSG